MFTKTPTRSLVAAGMIMKVLCVEAGDWTIVPRFSVDEIFSDNVTLATNDEIDDFVTQVTPGLSVRSEGGRFNSNVDYNLQHLIYASNSQFDSTNHQLQGDTEIELVKQRVFLDLNSELSQQIIDNQQRTSRSTRSVTNNRTDVMTTEVSPRIHHHFGDWASAQFTFRYRSNSYSGSSAGSRGDSDERGIVFDLNSGSELARTPIGFKIEKRTINFDSGRKNELESYTGDVSYTWSRKLLLTGTVGVEANRFDSRSRDTDGISWSFGGTWTPTPRTTLTGQWGERFFGNTFSVSLEHTHRRLRISAGYDEQLNTSSDVQRELRLVPLNDAFGDPVFDPVNNSAFDVPQDTPTLGDDVFLSKSIDVRFGYKMRRTDFDVSFNQRKRQSQGFGSNETVGNLRAEANRTISNRLTASVEYRRRDSKFQDSGRSEAEWELRPSLRYELGPHTSVRLRYEFTDNSSSGGGLGGYTENSVTANLTLRL